MHWPIRIGPMLAEARYSLAWTLRAWQSRARKPRALQISGAGQADSRLRPRARRRAITFWPPFVAIRARKPWRRLRTSFEG